MVYSFTDEIPRPRVIFYVAKIPYFLFPMHDNVLPYPDSLVGRILEAETIKHTE